MELKTNHTEQIHDVKFDFYGTLVATASADKLVKIFSLKGNDLKHIQDLRGHKGPVWSLAWAHPKFGKIVASCGYSKRLLVWRERSDQTWEMFLNDNSFASSVSSIEFSPYQYGLVVAAVTNEGLMVVYRFNTSSGTWNKSAVVVHNFGANSLSFAPHAVGQPLKAVTCGNDCLIKIWEFSGSENTEIWSRMSDEIKLVEKPFSLNSHSDWVRDVAWAPSFGGKDMIASASDDKTVRIWKRFTIGNGEWKCVSILKFDKAVCGLAWSSLGGVLAVSEWGCIVSYWEEADFGKWVKRENNA